MGTVTLFGDTYETVIMPDGKEWMTTNLAWIGAGRWRMDAAENDGCGRYYTTADVDAIKDLLPSAWRIPTYADSFALASLYPDVNAKDLAGPSGAWGYGGIATNESGLNLIPTGMRETYYAPPLWRYLGLPYDGYPGAFFYQELQTPPAGTGYSTAQTTQGTGGVFSFGPGNRYPENPLNSFPVRLVRDPNTKTPVISPASGTYVDPFEVTITCETEGSVIHYTTDGSEPDENSPIYTSPIDFRSLTGVGTVKAIAYSPTLPPSSVATVTYTIKLKVFIQPESGGYSDYFKCSIRTNHIVPETVVYYTIDGSEPTEASLVYSEPFTITPPYSGEFVVKAFAVNASFVTSDIETESYHYKAPSPIDKASFVLETGLEGFNPMTGKFNRLGCSGAILLNGNLTWELTDTEYELFMGWIAFSGGEEARLTIPMITGDVELPHVIQLLELPAVTRDTGIYSLSVAAKIITRPFPDSFSWEGWAGALYGPPASYPTELPSPQWSFSTAPQALFVATGGVSTAARLRQVRGSVVKASWKLSGGQFDYWTAWFNWTLGQGRRKFVFNQAGVGPWRCQFTEDPKVNIDGVNFTVTATLFYVETGT